MLGLGSGTQANDKLIQTINHYISDFTSDEDGWEGNSIQNSSSDLTFDANETIASTSGWLKMTFGVTQTSSWNIGKTLNNVKTGDTVILSMKIFVVQGSNVWDANNDGDNIQLKIGIGSKYVYIHDTASPVAFEFDTALDLEFVFTATGTSGLFTIQTNLSDDYPEAGAIFYIKDIDLKVLR